MKTLKSFMCLLFIAFSNGALAEQQIKIMLFGDSLMAGYGLTQNENLVSALSGKFEQVQTKVDIINASVSGNTSSNGLARIDWSLGDKPNVVVLCLGANDMLRGIGPTYTKENLKAIIEKINAHDATVILAGMQAPMNMGQDYQQQFDQLYPNLANEHDLIFMPFLLEGIALKAKFLQDDFKHPNALGVQAIADNLYPYLLQAMSEL